MRSRMAALLAALALIAGLLGLTAGPASAAGIGVLRGAVYDGNFSGVPGTTVALTDPNGVDVGLSTTTDQNGEWFIDSVPEGSYLVSYPTIGRFAYDAPDITGANQFQVFDGSDEYVFDQLVSYFPPPPNPNWQVKVVAPDGTPLTICADFFPADNVDLGPLGGSCGQDGDLTVGAFDPGTYKVRFMPESPDQATTWYGGDGSFATAATVTLTSDSVADLGTVAMRPAGQLSVVVRRADRKITFGEDQVCLTAFENRTQSYAGSGCTDGRGVAVIPSLGAGSYTLWAQPAGQNNLDYVPRWLGDLKTQDKSPLVKVVVGTTTAAGTITLPLSGRISGTIRDKKTGKPLAGYCAVIGDYSFLGGEDGTRTLTSTSCSGADGTYLIRGLDSGSYKITVVPGIYGAPTPGYAVGYYGGATYTTAKAVNVSLAKTTSKIDVGLGPEALISGSVVTSAGDPGYAVVFAYDAATGRSIGQAETYPGNDFTIKALPQTKVLLWFLGQDGVTPAWWDGTPDGTPLKSEAKPVTTTTGTTLTLDPFTFG